MSYILVVDDNRFVSTCVKVLLNKENYAAITADDGLQAMNIVRQQLPKAIICDVNMPRMDGYNFVKTLRQSGYPQHIPVIVYTTNKNENEKQLFFELGVSFYLDKSTGTDVLMHALRITCS